MIFSQSCLTALAVLLLTPLTVAEGLYSKDSAVLQINARNFDKLIKKSDYASVCKLPHLSSNLKLTKGRLSSEFIRFFPIIETSSIKTTIDSMHPGVDIAKISNLPMRRRQRTLTD